MVALEVGDGEDEGAHAEAEGPAQSDHPPALPALHNHRVPGHGVAHCALGLGLEDESPQIELFQSEPSSSHNNMNSNF